MKHSHVFDPAHIPVLESEDRKAWQNPEEVLTAVEPQPEWVAADLGCGSGYLTIPLSRMVRKVYGIDIQREMLSSLEDKIKRFGVRNIEPLLSQSNEIPLEDDSVDLLISANTLHEFQDRASMVREMRRVLRKNGKLLILDFKKRKTDFGPPVKIRVSKADAVRLFEKNGFALLKTKELPYHYLLVLVKD